MNLTDKRFQDQDEARKWLEQQRWPNGPYCPHCGNSDPEKITAIPANPKAKIRAGLHQCNECREQFTVTVGTVMERSKIPLNKWVAAMFLMSAGKKGTSAHQLHRTLGITYQSAWFLAHRIREAMKATHTEPLGGAGKIVEADETYYGSKDVVRTRTKHGRPGLKSKRPILALVERGGSVRSFHVKEATSEQVNEILARNIARESTLHTDESVLYRWTGKRFAAHETVTHSMEEWVRGIVHTNTIEGYFSVFKRGMRGVYQHCGEAHLHRYLAEFDFRYNRRSALGITDTERTEDVARGTEGKRLTYRPIN
jgi:transposase-like protein